MVGSLVASRSQRIGMQALDMAVTLRLPKRRLLGRQLLAEMLQYRAHEFWSNSVQDLLKINCMVTTQGSGRTDYAQWKAAALAKIDH